jgi:hypothetical protein
MKRIQNEFRTTMTPNKLCSLSLMFIKTTVCSLSIDDAISDFALAKARKKIF